MEKNYEFYEKTKSNIFRKYEILFKAQF